MSDLLDLFRANEVTERWKAELENASARLELARIRERSAFLISQHEPVFSLSINREKLRLILAYLQHGSVDRLLREAKEINP